MQINYTLSSTDIGEAIRLLDQEMKSIKLPQKSRISTRLAIEELFLSYRDRLGEDAGLSIQTYWVGKYFRLGLSITGEKYDPFLDHSSMFQALLDSMEEIPKYHYLNGRNIIEFQFEVVNATLKSIGFSWRYIHNHRRLLYLAAGSQLIGGLFAIASPIISAQIIQSFISNMGLQVLYIAIPLLIKSLLHNLFMYISNRAYSRVYTKTLSSLNQDLVKNMLQIENSCIDANGSGLFIQRLTNDTERIASGFNNMTDIVAQVTISARVVVNRDSMSRDNYRIMKLLSNMEFALRS